MRSIKLNYSSKTQNHHTNTFKITIFAKNITMKSKAIDQDGTKEWKLPNCKS